MVLSLTDGTNEGRLHSTSFSASLRIFLTFRCDLLEGSKIEVAPYTRGFFLAGKCFFCINSSKFSLIFLE